MLHLEVLLHHTVGRIRNEVHDNVQVDFVWLVTISVEGLAHLDAIGVMQHLEDLQLSVLVALVLEDLFDGDCLASLSDRRFEDNTEGAISDNFLGVVREALLLFDKHTKMAKTGKISASEENF